MRYGSVCSGIEAATQAWHPLGWTPVFFSEVDKFPSAVLAHHYGSNMPGERLATNGVPNLGDMTKFEEWPDYAIDLLVGGTPCQDYSIAGLRLGLDGSRGQLTLVFVEILGRYRPCWFAWENVPGVLSSNEGKDFARFLGDLSGQQIDVPETGWQNAGIVAGIADAYGLAWRVLDAQFTRTCLVPWAVPQRRRRVFVVGYLGDWRRAAAVLFDGEGLQGNSPPRRKAGQGTAHDVAPSLVSSGRGVDRAGDTRGQDPIVSVADPLLAGGHSNNPLDENLVAHAAPALTQNPHADNGDGREGLLVAHTLKAHGFDASEDGTGRGTPLIPVAAPLTAGMAKSAARVPHEQGALVPVAFDCKAGGETALSIGDVPGALRGDGHGGGHAAIAIQERAVSENPDAGPDGAGVRMDGAAYTLEARSVPQSVATGWAVRRLMPIECERLQGFPDDFTKIPWRGKAADQCPDGPRYKALGNSMAVNVMHWLGERIEHVNRLIKEAAE
ncbi:DNA (cytosine-5)-methyltransferase 1 [Labrenzia sp. EL_208]|nr:DNA (cytosine-5)-methyltransferase 1 [Labrenzia sp. EL_132]MBG6232964.1 DNA (cytosine-5)-methyltransferase 1 [Labrenzia sp. EL_208]